MAKANHPDLFGGGEPDLFGPAPAKAHVPDPEHVRNRFRALLDDMRAGPVWPWGPAMVALHRERTFDYLTGLLPVEEGAKWRDEIEAEVLRLDAAVIAAE